MLKFTDPFLEVFKREKEDNEKLENGLDKPYRFDPKEMIEINSPLQFRKLLKEKSKC